MGMSSMHGVRQVSIGNVHARMGHDFNWRTADMKILQALTNTIQSQKRDGKWTRTARAWDGS